jgi:Tfp pilus assembly protein PilN
MWLRYMSQLISILDLDSTPPQEIGMRHDRSGLRLVSLSASPLTAESAQKRTSPGNTVDIPERRPTAACVRSRRVSLLLGPESVAYRTFQVPEERGAVPEGVARFEAAQLIAGTADLVWDILLGPAEGGRADVLLVSTPQARIESVCAVVERGGARVEQVLEGASSLAAAYRFLHGGTSGSALILRITARNTQLVLVEGPYFRTRSVPIGAEPGVSPPADDAKRPLAAAQPFPSHGDRGRMGERMVEADSLGSRATESLAGRLQLEITRFLVHQRAPGMSGDPVPVFLCGSGAAHPGLCAELAARLRLPVEFLAAETGLTVEAGLGDLGRFRHDWPGWLGAALLSLELIAPGSTPNLLPPARRQARGLRMRQVTWAGAAAMLAFAGLPPAWHYHAQARTTEASVQLLETEVLRLERLVEHNQVQLRRMEAARARLTTLRELAFARQRWPRFLSELQTCLEQVEDAWLDSLQLDPATIGEASQPVRLRMAGRLLDEPEDAVTVGPESEGRVKALLTHLERSPVVTRVERERFERLEPGVLRFEVVLAMAGDELL